MMLAGRLSSRYVGLVLTQCSPATSSVASMRCQLLSALYEKISLCSCVGSAGKTKSLRKTIGGELLEPKSYARYGVPSAPATSFPGPDSICQLFTTSPG